MGNKRSTVKLINIHLYIMTNLGGSRHGEKQSCVHQCQERQLDFHVKHKHTPAAFLLYCMCTTHKSQTETLPSLSLSLSPPPTSLVSLVLKNVLFSERISSSARSLLPLSFSLHPSPLFHFPRTAFSFGQPLQLIYLIHSFLVTFCSRCISDHNLMQSVCLAQK